MNKLYLSIISEKSMKHDNNDDNSNNISDYDNESIRDLLIGLF